jgi:hypothetical protein
VWGGACQRRFALCCAVGMAGEGREGHSDKQSSHFVFTQLVFVCKMPVALFSASRNTLFDPVVAGACNNLCSSHSVPSHGLSTTTRQVSYPTMWKVIWSWSSGKEVGYLSHSLRYCRHLTVIQTPVFLFLYPGAIS